MDNLLEHINLSLEIAKKMTLKLLLTILKLNLDSVQKPRTMRNSTRYKMGIPTKQKDNLFQLRYKNAISKIISNVSPIKRYKSY